MPLISGTTAKLILVQNNTQDIDLFGLMDNNGTFLNDATLRATLLDGSRNPVANCVGIVLGYVLGSNGDYLGTIPAQFVATVGSEYVMVIDGDEAASHLHIEIPVEVRVRTS